MKENEDRRVAELREEAANTRQKAQTVTGYAQRQTMLLTARMLDDMADVEERRHLYDTERQRSAALANSAGGNSLPRPVERFQLLWFGGMVLYFLVLLD